MQTSDLPVEQHFFAGGGIMGALMHETDWAVTPLGDPASWPQSLKTCVRIVLTSRQPMFVWWGKDLVNIYNDAYLTIIGGKHPQALGQPAFDVWREIWDEVRPRAEAAMRDNVGTYDEALLLIMERNGYPEETYYTFSYSPVPGDDGAVAGIICANTDDTERIINERHLRTLKDIGNTIPGAVTVKDIYDRTIEVLKSNPQDFPFAVIYETNAAGSAATFAGSTTIGIPAEMSVPEIHFDGDGQMAKLLEPAMQSGRASVTSNAGTYFDGLPGGAWKQSPDKILVMPVSRSGQKTPFALLVVGLNPYRLPDEKYLGFFDLVADQLAAGIANVQAYEEERKRAEALMEIDRAKTTFFSNISHEFRTPLTLMLGPLEAMLEGDAITEQQRTGIAATHRNAMRLLRLVNALLDFSRIEAGRMQARFTQLDLGAFTTDLAANFRSLIEQAGLVFEVHTDKISTPVYADPQMWEKIVLNLLSNAYKYTFSGKITVSLVEENGQAVLRVADTGIGIPAAELPKMFDRFHRVQDANGRTHEGTGIGLSLVKELVQLHAGNIAVNSEEGKGSVFTVMLPLGNHHLEAGQIAEGKTYETSTQADIYLKEAMSLTGTDIVIDEQAGTFRDKEGAGPAIASTLHVLVVDDNADMRNYVKNLLGRDYIIDTAGNGREALERIAAHRPDLVVSDIMMPVMDGIALLHAVKNNPETAAVPVILLSARAGEEARIEGYDIGADDYLVKPFSAKELLSRVRAQLRLARKQRRAEGHIYNLFVQAPVAIGIYRGPSFIIDMVNDQMLDFWDRNYDDVIRRPLFDVFPEIAAQGFKALIQQVYQTGTRYVSDETPLMLMRSGRMDTIYVKIVFEPLREEDGTISGVMSMASDITDLYKAKEKLSDAEERMRLAAEGTGMATWDLDLRTREIIYTPRLPEIFGYGTEGIMNHALMRERIHPDDRDATVEKAFMKAMHHGYYEYEARIYRKDNDALRWIKTQGRVIYDEQGKPLRMLGTMIDITDAKIASKKLEDSEQHYRQLIQSLPVALYTCDAAGRVELFNDAAVKLWGRVPEAGKDMWGGAWKIYAVNGVLLHADDYPMAITLRNGRSSGSRELIIERPDGSRTYVLLYPEVLKDADGKVTGAVNMLFDLTERKAAAENMAMLAAIVQSSDDAIISKTLDGIVTSWNGAAEKIFGYTETEIIGQPILLLIPEDRLEEEKHILQQIRSGQRINHFETQRVTKDGRIIDASITVSPMKDAQGNLVGASKILRDITGRKLAERALRESEERFRNVADTAPVMIWIADSDKKYSFFNKVWLDFTGHPGDDALHEGWNNSIHPDDFGHCMELYSACLAERKPFEMEYRMRRHDGAYRWVVDHGVPRYCPDGTVLGYIGSCIDIHERKEASEELERRVAERTSELRNKNEELVRQKEFVETILDASVDMISVLDKDLNYIAINKKALEMYGADIVGKNLLEAFPHVRETGMYDGVLNALAGEIVHQPEYMSPVLKRYFENFYIPLKDQQGEVREIMLIGHDITDYMNASQELKEMNEALTKSNGELEQFAYVSSHDLQEPLRKIQTFSDLLTRNVGKEGFDARRYIDKINASAERMTTLIKDLLSYSRLSKTSEQFVVTDLGKILENVTCDFEVVIKQKNAVIRSMPMPAVKAIPIQLNQLFYNLIGNALKFSENAPVIDISCAHVSKTQMKSLSRLNPLHSYIRLSFKDNGIGFEQLYAEKIFTIFQRLNDREQYSGTGIGLAICKKIAENHNGYIEAQSRPGEGAEFVVYIAI